MARSCECNGLMTASNNNIGQARGHRRHSHKTEPSLCYATTCRLGSRYQRCCRPGGAQGRDGTCGTRRAYNLWACRARRADWNDRTGRAGRTSWGRWRCRACGACGFSGVWRLKPIGSPVVLADCRYYLQWMQTLVVVGHSHMRHLCTLPSIGAALCHVCIYRGATIGVWQGSADAACGQLLSLGRVEIVLCCADPGHLCRCDRVMNPCCVRTD